MSKKQPRRPRHIPHRTCVVCREKFDKRRLTRIVRSPDAGVVVDFTGKQNGRGAYLCDRESCWIVALNKSEILDQALMTEVTAAEREEIASHRPILDARTE